MQNKNFFLYLLATVQCIAKVAVHYNCRAKKYSFGFTIGGYILIFSGAKNSYIAI